MNPETIKALQDALTPLADKIGQGAAHLYGVYARQMLAEGIAELVIMAFLLILGIGALVQFLKVFLHLDQWQREDRHYASLKEEAGFRLVIFGISAIVAIAFGCVLLFDGVTKVVNPEYAAIQRLVETVRGTNK